MPDSYLFLPTQVSNSLQISFSNSPQANLRGQSFCSSISSSAQPFKSPGVCLAQVWELVSHLQTGLNSQLSNLSDWKTPWLHLLADLTLYSFLLSGTRDFLLSFKFGYFLFKMYIFSNIYITRNRRKRLLPSFPFTMSIHLCIDFPTVQFTSDGSIEYPRPHQHGDPILSPASTYVL